MPTTSAVGSLFSNYANSPKLFEHSNSFDTRMDIDFNDKNQLFYRFSLVDDPNSFPAFSEASRTAAASSRELRQPSRNKARFVEKKPWRRCWRNSGAIFTKATSSS